MLVTLKEILKIAEEKKCAIGAFNTPDMTCARAIIAAAEETNSPVIIMHAQVHEEMGLCSMEEVAPMMLFYAKRAKVPVCVHLDHGTDVEYVKRGQKKKHIKRRCNFTFVQKVKKYYGLLPLTS